VERIQAISLEWLPWIDRFGIDLEPPRQLDNQKSLYFRGCVFVHWEAS